MHFWINKPAGRYYGFSGRRYPTSPFPKNRVGQRRISRSPRSMIPAVHRFQSNDIGNAAGPSYQASRPPRASSRNNNERRNCPSRASSLPLLQPDNTNNTVNNAENNQQVHTNVTSATNRRFLDFAEFNEADPANYRFRCSVWIVFFLITGFVAGAKFYFEFKGTGFELIIFSGLLITLLLSGCLYSILYRRRQIQQLQDSQAQNSQVLCSNNPVVSESTRQISIVRQNPPPPYHIAILIPPINSLEDVPPPSYDKIMQ